MFPASFLVTPFNILYRFQKISNIFKRTTDFKHRIMSNFLSTSSVEESDSNALVLAAVQMCSTSDKNENMKKIIRLSHEARRLGANFVCLPENCVFMGTSARESFEASEYRDGPSTTSLCDLAKSLSIWLSVGGLQEKRENSEKIGNTHLLISPTGSVVARYTKVQMKIFYSSLKCVFPDGMWRTDSFIRLPNVWPNGIQSDR